MAVTDEWVVPETILNGIYDDTITLEEATKLLDKQIAFWGVEDPEIESTLHFLNLMKE